MRPIRIYTTRWCGYCVRAKLLLDSRRIPYEEVSLDDDPAFRAAVDAGGPTTVVEVVEHMIARAIGTGGHAHGVRAQVLHHAGRHRRR